MTSITRYPYTGPGDVLDVPRLEAPWTSARTSRTIAHQLLESSKNVFTLRDPAPRTGLIVCRFPTSEAAHTAADFLASPAEFDLYPVDPPELSARFVIAGGATTITQDVGSWTVSFAWMEVLP
ncbi:hypothetical protein [Microbacterium aurum]|uniref:hypothetical protein n=1 Tax=Microbacterium aurum TaxID=36805 RepID=UPI0028E7A9C2|nr:hypothetical protein [Microbacterium aurum]